MRSALGNLGAVRLSRAVAARILPFGAFILFLVARSLAHGESPAWSIARDAFVAVLLAFFWRDYTELRDAPRATPGQSVAAVAVGLAVFLAWIALDAPWNSLPMGAGFDPFTGERATGWALAAARLAGLVIVVPLMEELFWRSFLLRWIDSRNFIARDPRAATSTAVLLTCLAFGAEHSQWVAGLLAGAAYTAVYVRTRNILLTILSHAITNGLLGIWILSTGNWRFW